MGVASSSATARATVNSLTSVVNSAVSSVTQNLETTCSGINIFKGNLGIYPSSFSGGEVTATLPCTPEANINSFTLNQTINNTCSIVGGITSTINQDVTNKLTEEIKTWLKTNANANNGFLGFGISIAKSQNISEDDLAQMISNTISSNIAQVCKTGLDAANIAEVYFCGEYPNGIAISQSAVNTNITSCIVNNTITAISNNDTLNNISTQAAAEADASNSGLDSLFKWLIIAGIALAVVILIGIILYFIFGGKSKPQEEATKLGPEQTKMALQRIEMSKLPEEKKAFLEKAVIYKSSLPAEEKQKIERSLDVKIAELNRSGKVPHKTSISGTFE